jgi:hypothetical protein
MTNDRAPLALTLVAAGTFLALVLWWQPYSAEWPGTGFTQPAQRFLRAAMRRDSTALAHLSATGQPVAWALTAARTQPGSLATWAHDAQAWVGERRGDTTEVFVFNASAEICPTSPIRVRFVGSGAHARVVQASAPCWERR